MTVLLSVANLALRRSLIRALVSRGHTVTIVGRDAERSAAEWPAQVTPYEGAATAVPRIDVNARVVVDDTVAVDSETPAVRAESPLELPAVRGVHITSAPARRTLAPSSLEIVPSTVYGTGQDPVTVFLMLMRALPAVPARDDVRWQLTWHEDLAAAAAAALELPEQSVSNRSVRVAGPQIVAPRELYEEIAALIDRRPAYLRVPQFVARHGVAVARRLGLSHRVVSDMLEFLARSDVLLEPRENALTSLFGIAGTPLRDGLTRIVQQLDELTPFDGVGSIEVKRFHADIAGSLFTPSELMGEVRRRFAHVMPVELGIEPAAAETGLVEGHTITMHLPGRGHVEVRVERASDDEVVLSTLRGHALAGFVRFRVRGRNGALRFQVLTCNSAANPLDWFALRIGGDRVQQVHWITVVRSVIALSGGHAGEVSTDTNTLYGDDARQAQRWISDVIEARRRREHTAVSARLR